jgi:Protein of unknown function (DUF2000)
MSTYYSTMTLHLDRDNASSVVGYLPDEIRTDEPTRAARLKWVIVVDEALPAGRAVNSAVCVAAATSAEVPGLLGPDAVDAAGLRHPGLPWAGCSILAAPSAVIADIRSRATSSPGVFVADMPAPAQHTRVYDDYLDRMTQARSDEIGYYAVSIIGPRNRVDKLVRRLDLLG